MQLPKNIIQKIDMDREALAEHVRTAAVTIALGTLCMMVLMLIWRLAFIVSFAFGPLWRLDCLGVFDFAVTSFRFDLKYAAQAFIPALAAAIIMGLNKGWAANYKKLFPWLNILAFLAICTLSIINYFYYLTYESVIDVFFFAFFREDAAAVTETVMSDYPVFSGTIIMLIAMVAYALFYARVYARIRDRFKIPQNPVALSVVTVLLIAVFFLCMRASLGHFPLRQTDADATTEPIMNAAVLNGPAAMYGAWRDNKRQNRIPSVSSNEVLLHLHKMGLEATDGDMFYPLRQTSPMNGFLWENPPDVVLGLIESWSMHMLTYDVEESFDLYGSFRQHARDDYYFTNFISEGNGTIDSIARLMLSVPDMNFSTSVHAKDAIVQNALRIYKNKGYRIVFVSAGLGSWRNIESFVLAQGADEFYGQNDIIRAVPNATVGTWGVDDRYLWEFILKYLREKPEDQSVLVIALTVTNHPPYRVPEGIEPQVMDPGEDTRERFPYDADQTNHIFATLRYSTDELGRFISAAKEDEKLSPRTIIAATGDHNLRGIGYNDNMREFMLGFAVPFYMHVPERYREKDEIYFDGATYGSHKDVFATLINHSLSDVAYYSMGCDLLNPKIQCAFNFAYNAEGSIMPETSVACSETGQGPFRTAGIEPGTLLGSENRDDEDGKCRPAFDSARLQQLLYFYQANHQEEIKKYLGLGQKPEDEPSEEDK